MLRFMSVDKALEIKVYIILSEYLSSHELNTLSKEIKATTIYNKQRN